MTLNITLCHIELHSSLGDNLKQGIRDDYIKLLHSRFFSTSNSILVLQSSFHKNYRGAPIHTINFARRSY